MPQNVFSSPQKQPSANSAISRPSGDGPAIGRSRMVGGGGFGRTGLDRPGRALVGDGIVAGLPKKDIVGAPVWETGLERVYLRPDDGPMTLPEASFPTH